MKKTIKLGLKSIVACGALCVPFLTVVNALAESGITGWNRCSKQFIDSPVFRLLPVNGASEYRATVRQAAKTWTVRSKKPLVSLADVWREVEAKRFSLDLEWIDAAGKVIADETSLRVKAPDFAGFNEPVADWSATADRNVAYLIKAADHGVVADQPAYTNLSQMPVMPLIRYLCRHRDENPAYLPTAIRLNRWIEDQFVTFGPENEASPVRVKGPLVFEQFVCWWPMEGHTGNWILALIELHKATGRKGYLDKARAAANAICAGQYLDGQFSTFGRDHRTGMAHDYANRSGGGNWYNANAMADWALYALRSHTRTLIPTTP